MINVGTRIYALGACALGIVGLVFGDFALVWQPVPATLPGRTVLAYVFAALLLLGGLALNWPRTARRGAALLCVLFALVVLLLHLPRVVTHPAVFGVWSGTAEQLALLAGAWLALQLCSWPQGAPEPAAVRLGLRVFAGCLLVFGGAHFFYLEDTAAFVPHWLPPGQRFWAVATGLAHIAAGVAILSGVQARLAAILATVMFASFSLLIHLPLLLSEANHFHWVMNAMNLALTGSAWIAADALTRRERG
ncbi:MAG TPA: DoxX family protein [Steroidobacteraceae bacterium]|jgi:uncharacterized membrane protein YphA (DoxX/SURF4 family)|nr:DoxX family protein [Steroidobacteraceae bacterium]